MTREEYIALVDYAITKKCKQVGGMEAAAKEINISRQTLLNWKRGLSEIPYFLAVTYFGINEQMIAEFEFSEYSLRKKLDSYLPEEFVAAAKEHGYTIELVKIKPKYIRPERRRKMEVMKQC